MDVEPIAHHLRQIATGPLTYRLGATQPTVSSEGKQVMIRVLAVTLYSGENEFQACCASVHRQVGVDVTHRVISNRPKREAHQELYRQFNDDRKEFDFFIKIDADMVLTQSDVIVRMINSFEQDVDIVSYTVWDRITASRIGSINCFRNTCEFLPEDNDKLFTDRLPIRFGGRQVWVDDKENLVLHAPDPTDFQAFMFGVHRSFKVLQRGADEPNIESSHTQMKILQSVWRNYRLNNDPKAMIALIAGGLVFSGHINEVEFKSKDSFRKYFDILNVNDWEADDLSKFYANSATANLVRIFGFRGFVRGVVSTYRRRGPFGLFKRHISLLRSRMPGRR